MKLEFDNLEQLAEFAGTYALGVRAAFDQAYPAKADETSITNTVGDLSQTFKVTGALGRLQREILLCAMRDTGLTEEQLTAPINPRESELDETQTEPEAEDGEQVTFDPIELPETEKTEAPAPEAPKRKRRTKAEIAADEAAAKAATPGEGNEPQPDGGEGEEPEAGPIEQPTPAEAAVTIAAIGAAESDAYTDEVLAEIRGMADMFGADRKAHLDEGRTAIQTKGWIPYMATFKGIGQSPNIATYNDDEVKLHRAAIARLLAS